MWISIEGRLLVFLYRYDQGWVCVKEAGEGAGQRFTKIISFSTLSCQQCQPFLSQLSHVNSWFLITMTEVEANSRLGTRKCRWGQCRAAIWFYSWSKFQFHQQPICFGRFLHSFLSFSLCFLHLCTYQSLLPIFVALIQLAVQLQHITKGAEISGTVVGCFKMLIESL